MSGVTYTSGTNPPKGFHYEAGRCPLAGTNYMCNCTGQCAVRLVPDSTCSKPTIQAGTDGSCTRRCGHDGCCVEDQR